MSTIVVLPIGGHPTVACAAEELAGYLGRMTGESTQIRRRAEYAPDADAGLWLGLAADLPGIDLPAVEDPAVDDAIFIEVEGRAGVLAGTNPRSVLLAVYRWLTRLGCRWVRPGPDGEYVPQVSLDLLSTRIVEAAAYRHRGICIEGGVSEEHVRNMIEWAPRVGFNAYFIQFREAYTFFERWYAHRGNPLIEPEPFSVEQARAMMDRLVQEIKRRDLLYHAVGHGWTCEPFGLSGLGWEYEPVEAPEEVRPYLALVNGERQLWGGVPLNTNLCYSHPEVRRVLTDDIVEYAASHPEVDLLHLWLADGSNNHCECEACLQARPADWYVILLNQVDEALTARGLPTRLVFLIYVDLLWPPERERFRRPERFVLMFAPITRSYSRPFPVAAADIDLPPYERNRLRFPRSVEENVACLRAWRRLFEGDSFDFDYHFMWDHYNDPGSIQSAQVVHEDVRRLRAIGLNGLVSCQTQRACFPTGLGMTAMGWALWRPDIAFETIAEDYFRAAFGPDGAACRAYLERLSRLFSPAFLRGEEVAPEAAPALADVPAHLAGFRPVIERNLQTGDPCHAASWRYLDWHADLCGALAQAYRARAAGDREQAGGHWREVQRQVCEREEGLHTVLDVYLFIRTVGRRFGDEGER